MALALIFLAASCGKNAEQQAAEKADGFATAADEYTLESKAFGIRIRRPEGWQAMGFDQLNDLVDMGTDVATAGKDDLKAFMAATEKNNFTLFAITQFEAGAAVDENPNVMGVAEKVSHAPGVKTGKDYFFHAKKLMAQANPNFTFTEGYQTRMIGGVAFDQMDVVTEVGPAKANQSYYAAKHDAFIVLIIQTYVSDEGKKATSDIIDTVELDW